jgi:hypothetical protein
MLALSSTLGAVDPFALIITGIVAALVVWVLILGRYSTRSTADILDWRPTRSPEVEAQNEIDDVVQMLEATNEKKRRRGARELTEEEVSARVREEQREANARRERYLRDLDVQQMLEATNARRRARGERELTEEEYRAQVEGTAQ